MAQAPNWSNFQSLIQLAAALNFGFAGFEFLLSTRLTALADAKSRQSQLMIDLRKSGGEMLVSAAQNQRVKRRIDTLEKVEAKRISLNATLSVLSGLLGIAFLARASEYANEIPSSAVVWLVIGLSYGWFATSVGWMLCARCVIFVLIRPDMVSK